jgi:hypothetical protein
MPDDHDEHAGPGERDALDDVDERDEFDDNNDYEDEDEPGLAGGAWPGTWDPPGPGGAPSGSARRRGLLFALTAVVAAAAGFGVVAVAIKDVSGSPAAASSSPSAAAPAPSGSAGLPSGEPTDGTGLSPQAGGIPALPAGATLRLEVGGQVTAVSPTSITIGSGGNMVTAAVTRATKVTGKVAGAGGIKDGDLVSATITGANGKLTAVSIQDPASLPSAPGQ